MDTKNHIAAFIERWQGVTASELSTAQSFVMDLCTLLGVPAPHATAEQDYMFERPVTFRHGDGSATPGRIDCYRRAHFVLEAKKLKAGVQTKGFDDALLRARAQAEGYARALPAGETRPPFLVVIDVGHVIELYAEFTRSGATYTPFPDPRSHRIRLADLHDATVLERLRAIWLDPLSLDPARASAKVTREVAEQLAVVARSMEAAGHAPQAVAAFLTRCLFSMFAEDVELLPKTAGGDGAFVELLKRHRDDPQTLQNMLRVLWADMDRGGFSAALARDVLRFNGKLFKSPASDGYVLPLTREQIDGLLAAARANWREVEPAIFGTLLERALDPAERQSLGAHYTPRAYVERLVLPTVVEPLRADWADAQAAALLLATEAAALDGRKRDDKLAEARATIRRFHHKLCSVRVLDPACGSGNFLYVTLEHLKRLEGEVFNQLEALAPTQSVVRHDDTGAVVEVRDARAQLQHALDLAGETVTLQQLLGIEVNPRAAAVAELVLWIGYLQWHIRTFGNTSVAEPVIHDYGNIECRDAVLACDGQRPMRDAQGRLVTRWDGRTLKTHPVTGEEVPDESAQVPQWEYLNPRQAQWPQADFIVGNPPFIGAGPMRAALGDGYVDALRRTWADVPESCDFVMYWWQHAANLVREGKAQRFGLITTNSVRQPFNRRVLEQQLRANPPLFLAFAVADHPWVDSAQGAAVRIAMTVGLAGSGDGRLLMVLDERPCGDGEIDVSLDERHGTLHANLRIGANVAAAATLLASTGISSPGVKLHGAGFIVSPADAAGLGFGDVPGLERHVRQYRNGRDLTDRSRNALVIDLFGLTVDDVRTRFPAIYQHVLHRVRPEREQNNRAIYRTNWWVFGEPRRELRPALAGLSRYVATVETAKHRTFQFLDASILPDNKLIVMALEDALQLGVLSSVAHVAWALAAGSWLGVGNDPVYVKTRCFETFPFPSDDTGLTPALAERIRSLAEQIDAHRKRRQAAHETLTLTGIYNVLEKLRSGAPLSAKDKTIHEDGLVSVLKTLHDELDAAVLAAYGWSDLALPRDEEELLVRLVALNAKRAAEEAQARIRWLRPEFQDPARRGAAPAAAVAIQAPMDLDGEPAGEPAPIIVAGKAARRPWPAALPEQVRSVSELLAASAAPLGVDALAAHFSGRGPWKKRLPQILQTLAALGRAREEGPLWRSA